MVDKNFLQSFLKLNTPSDRMTDSDVRSVLSRAGWAQTEIEAALALLKSGVPGGGMVPQMAGVGVPAVMQPTTEFSSEQLSRLLGVDVEVDPDRVRKRQAPVDAKSVIVRIIVVLLIVILSLSLAAALGAFLLYVMQIGPFKP